ncbi:RDD family protein [Kitasatospora sp. NBC_01266]|uniref:RDD family protein n=1 Tax=Kitasatospora sp. NBC_01266 TaxID=2903572 RepID=UPI002E3005C1|nr:RDD family protein [Kitasatospora sp. NBC_01266]
MSDEARWRALIGPGRPVKEPRPAVAGMAPWGARAGAALLEISIASGVISAYGYLLYFARPAFALIQTVGLLLGFHMQPLFQLGYWASGSAFLVWQAAERGRTGQSLGQRLLRIVTVDEDTGRPVGVARSLVRSALHVADIAPGFFGCFRPLVHYRRQTFADQISRTVVVEIDVINKMAEVVK